MFYTKPEQINPLAYYIFIGEKTINISDPNRYKLHYYCAHNCQDILYDIAKNAIDVNKLNTLDLWFNLLDSKDDDYRIAFPELIGVDLGKIPTNLAKY
ncbi:MAG TPA: hypothetical protein VFK40_02930 [Nitrososphaeraceae archaeon]|nr:hypothetical protein [Nitrososphaeraceae archaeon]